MKSRMVKLVELVAHIRVAYKILIGNPEGKRPYG
jgi:hypothetical protein